MFSNPDDIKGVFLGILRISLPKLFIINEIDNSIGDFLKFNL